MKEDEGISQDSPEVPKSEDHASEANCESIESQDNRIVTLSMRAQTGTVNMVMNQLCEARLNEDGQVELPRNSPTSQASVQAVSVHQENEGESAPRDTQSS